MCWPCRAGKKCVPGFGLRDCISGLCIPMPVVDGARVDAIHRSWSKNDTDVGNWTEFYKTRNTSVPTLPYLGAGAREAPPWLRSYDEIAGAVACDVAALVAPESLDMMGAGPTCSWPMTISCSSSWDSSMISSRIPRPRGQRSRLRPKLGARTAASPTC